MSDVDGFPEDLLVGLTPEQRDAVTSTERQILVRATAGSGKTHVLTLRIQRRVALGQHAPGAVLALTFTRKAADELRRRLARGSIRDVRAGTFHRAALTLLNERRADEGRPPVVIEPSRRRLVTQVSEALASSGVRIDDWQIPRLEVEVGWALSQGLTGSAYLAQARRHRRDSPLRPAQFAELLDRYVGLCRSRGVVDFDLLLSEAIALLRDVPAVRASVRHRTRALYVDEAQDMNPLQFALLREIGGPDPDLFAVGDANQSIYGFNGANPGLLEDLVATWPRTVVIDLTRNHRSTAPIVTVASTLLDPGARPITPALEEGPLPVVRSYETDTEEAANVVRWITLHHHPGAAWRDLAVLARTNAQLDPVARALEAAGVPFERRGPEHAPASDLVGAAPSRHDTPVSPDAVALSTIHRAKGLEFAGVAVIGWAEGQLPHYAAVTPEQLAEERRLAYVALSRAEEHLLITWSRGRDDPRFPDREPSRFLAPVHEALARLQRSAAPVTGEALHRRLAALREQLGASADPGPGDTVAQ